MLSAWHSRRRLAGRGSQARRPSLSPRQQPREQQTSANTSCTTDSREPWLYSSRQSRGPSGYTRGSPNPKATTSTVRSIITATGGYPAAHTKSTQAQ